MAFRTSKRRTILKFNQTFTKNIIYASFENCFDVFMDYRGFSFLLEPSIIGYEEKDKGSMQNSLRLDEWIRVDARENQ